MERGECGCEWRGESVGVSEGGESVGVSGEGRVWV